MATVNSQKLEQLSSSTSEVVLDNTQLGFGWVRSRSCGCPGALMTRKAFNDRFLSFRYSF
jgi:hypothetical protein